MPTSTNGRDHNEYAEKIPRLLAGDIFRADRWQSVVRRCSREQEEEITANEDLMREHGVLRRALLVYFLTARKLRTNPQDVRPQALHQTATLFRRFGEDYHERAFSNEPVERIRGVGARIRSALSQVDA
jgi:hypothetical protein